MFCTLENGLAVRNVSSILKPYVISFCESTERYHTFFTKNMSPRAIAIIPSCRIIMKLSKPGVEIESKQPNFSSVMKCYSYSESARRTSESNIRNCQRTISHREIMGLSKKR